MEATLDHDEFENDSRIHTVQVHSDHYTQTQRMTSQTPSLERTPIIPNIFRENHGNNIDRVDIEHNEDFEGVSSESVSRNLSQASSTSVSAITELITDNRSLQEKSHLVSERQELGGSMCLPRLSDSRVNFFDASSAEDVFEQEKRRVSSPVVYQEL